MEGAKPRESGLVSAPRKYNDELRERAQRLVREARERALSLNAAVLQVRGASHRRMPTSSVHHNKIIHCARPGLLKRRG